MKSFEIKAVNNGFTISAWEQKYGEYVYHTWEEVVDFVKNNELVIEDKK